MNVMKAREMAPSEGSLTVIAGPPGLGKSWFCGTMAEHLDPSEVLVVATLPREIKSHKYQEHNLDTILCADPEWLPDEGKIKASGFKKLTSLLEELREDTTYKGLVIDNGTQMAELAWHAALEPFGVGDPIDLGGRNKWDPYTKLREKLEQVMNSIALLTGHVRDEDGNVTDVDVAQPKLIAIPWHVQPPKETPGDDDSADEKAKGSEYEGEYLPQIRGGFRRRLGALVDNFVYADRRAITNPKTMTRSQQYVVQVQSDNERHVKLVGPMPDEKYIPNSWPAFMELISSGD